MTKTITEIIKTINGLQNSIDKTNKARDTLQEFYNITKNAGLPDDVSDKIGNSLNDVYAALGRNLTDLQSYKRLIEDIADQSKVEWPPACGTLKGGN